jgi:hypothetical protein
MPSSIVLLMHETHHGVRYLNKSKYRGNLISKTDLRDIVSHGSTSQAKIESIITYCRQHMHLKGGIFFDGGQEEDLYRNSPLLDLRKKLGKLGKSTKKQGRNI